MGIKKRDPLFVIIASLVTLGIYLIYWFYQTSKELIEINNSKSSPVLWTIGFFIPIVAWYVFWRYSELESKIGTRDNVLIFILWLVFFPAAMWLTQEDLNKKATE